MKVRIQMTGHGKGKLFLDEVEIHGVRSIGFDFNPREANVVRLELLSANVGVEIDEATILAKLLEFKA